MKKEYLIYILVSVALIFYIIYIIGQIRITVDFKELEPFKGSLPVFYKGFKLGHTSKVYPGPDYQSTRVDLKIRLKNLELPENTYAMIRRKDKKDYIELVYPNSPYLASLRNNSLIEGKKGIRYIVEETNGTVNSYGEQIPTVVAESDFTE